MRHAEKVKQTQLFYRCGAAAPEKWLAKPSLLRADQDAEYAAVYEIDLAEIKEPILCCPNAPDDARPLSQVASAKIDEVFIGSCMTNIGHFRAAGKLLDKVEGGSLATRLWPDSTTRMDEHQLMEEGSQHLRPRRCAHGNAGLLAVHGQPGACGAEHHLRLDLDA